MDGQVRGREKRVSDIWTRDVIRSQDKGSTAGNERQDVCICGPFSSDSEDETSLADVDSGTGKRVRDSQITRQQRENGLQTLLLPGNRNAV